MPTRRKEIRFFDRDYGRGLAWYETFFPPADQRSTYRAIGEISPQYYKSQPCPKRVFTTLPKSKLLLSLRQPIDRAYSVYGFHVQRRNFRGSFEDFLAARPQILAQGFYSRYIDRYLRYFDRAQILVLVFETAVNHPTQTKAALAQFLDISPEKFPSAAGSKRVNASSIPRARRLYSFAVKIAHHLHGWQLDWVIDFIRRLDIERFLAKGRPMPPLDPDLRARLSLAYQAEFDKLEQQWAIDLNRWRQLKKDL